MNLQPLGEYAWLARFATIDEASRWANALRAQRLAGVVDVASAYHDVAIHADPDAIDLDDLGRRLHDLAANDSASPSGRRISVPVVYDGEDLAEVASRLDLSTEQVIAAHSGCDYRVFAVGFQPGFPYAGDLPPELRGLPRRATPRTRVPAGSVALVGRQTGIYPTATPGGWHLIGRTPSPIVDVARGYFPIQAGDRLRFQPIGPDQFEAFRNRDL